MIESRSLGVDHRQFGGDEGLLYRMEPSELTFKPVRERALREGIDAVRNKVKTLIRLAELGQARGKEGVEPEAAKLSVLALPSDGLFNILGRVHPRIATVQDVAADLPWEILEERYLLCKNGHQRRIPAEATKHDRFSCLEQCGEMERVQRKLVEDHHLTHLVYGDGQSSIAGQKFLLIVDPRGDLFQPPVDPGGYCEQHCREIQALMAHRGYEVIFRSQANATVRAVVDLISDPATVGVYYFGHGKFSSEKGEGYLLLADGELSAREIEEAQPKPKFVFLNACSAGEAGGAFDYFERRARSVAQAFARGAGKVVVAPVFPVFNVHAAGSALHFFQHAMENPLADALASVRRESMRLYQKENLPHLSWFAYRYFGNANALLPEVREAPLSVPLAGVSVPGSRIFDGYGRLQAEVFSFPINEILAEAAARCNRQGRRHLTVMDLLAGLIRKGDLTRFLFLREGAALETLCAAIEQSSDPGTTEPNGNRPHECTATKRDDFCDELASLLEEADQRAGQDHISEQDLLEMLVDGGAWVVEGDLGLPAAGEIHKRLQGRKRAGVDDNGIVSLEGLDVSARNIIETAHALAQQRGMEDIPHRLMMAGLVANGNGFGARVCRCAGVNPDLLNFVMIALAEGDDFTGAPRTFRLSPEVCRKVVTPVLEESKKIAEGGIASERDLFRAFCRVASPAFKEWIREFPADIKFEDMEWGKVDLDDLGLIDPEFWEKLLEGLDDDSQKVIRTMHALSQDCGETLVPNRLVVAAFLSDPHGLASVLLTRRQISAETLRAQLISASDRGVKRKFPLNEAACRRAISPMLGRARKLANEEPVTEATLFRAFCEVAPAELKQSLRAPAWGMDLDVLAKEALQTPALGESLAGVSTALDHDRVTEKWDLHPFQEVQFDAIAWDVLQESASLAAQQGWNEVRSPHLLAALLGTASSALGKVLEDLPANAPDLRTMALSMVPPPPSGVGSAPVRLGQRAQRVIFGALQLAGQSGHTQATAEDLFAAVCAQQDGPVSNLLRELGANVAARGSRVQLTQRCSTLSTFGVDLTEKAKQGELPEIVGRDDEITTALQTLMLLENANPLLIGEAGIGKTAIVEGIAQRIVQGPCPKKLQSMRVIELSAGRLVANTRLRGEFEQRIQEILAEAQQGVILFIDEVHTIMGAGSAEGSGPDASNMLKTALARGEIRLIGATTNAEFKRSIAKDKALSRRFQVQMIGPPSREATIQVLSARRPALERHHEVEITDEAKVAAVDLSGRYIIDKQWPAKARDVLERACALATSEGTLPQDGSRVLVTANHVATVVSRWTGVPLERLSATEWQLLVNLEERLGNHIVGQHRAIRTVADAIRRRRSMGSSNRPWGVFLFVGPPGVGKTALATVISEEVFGGPDGLIRFDMGDFSEAHSTAKLIGAPPGYVGYEEGAPLVERLRRHPYSLLLFDEIEHAHENVLAVLLRLFSEGVLADQEGNLADGRNCLVVLTSNLLAAGEQNRRMGFTDGATPVDQSALRSLLERKLPPKLIDRLDGIVRFDALTVDDLQLLVTREVADRKSQVEGVNLIKLEITPEVTPWLVARVSEAGQGARAVRRTVDQHLGTVLTAGLSQMERSDTRCLIVSVHRDGLNLDSRWEITQDSIATSQSIEDQ